MVANPDEFVREVWLSLLGRAPDSATLQYLTGRLAGGWRVEDFVREVMSSPEAQSRGGRGVSLFVPPGHYYSPVVDPEQLKRSSFDKMRATDELLGLDLDLDRMQQTFERFCADSGRVRFPTDPGPDYRYYYNNEMYNLGDASILSAMIRDLRPKRYIEVGSGFSSAVVLDTLDRMPAQDTACTFVEPFPDRLYGLLREQDRDRVTIIESGVQDVPLSTFLVLAAGDVLFLDTTHISKAGSDVNWEVFQILPRLASGVVVHFHDVFAKFEYLDDWVFKENRSWNELYVLRAFLMYNSAFEIVFANDSFAENRPRELARLGLPAGQTLGGGLWLRKR